MSRTSNAGSPVEGNVIRFEVRDGMRRIGFAVLGDALEAVSGLTVPSTAMLRQRSFDRFRTLINVAARLKLKTLPAGSSGPVILTREDLRRVPPEAGVPSFGNSARGPSRPASPTGAGSVSSATTSSDPGFVS
jgi:hypothetical protein